MIREANLDDLDELVALGKEFITLSGLCELTPYSEPYAKLVFKSMIKGNNTFVFVLSLDGKLCGFCGGRVGKFIFSNQGLLGQEDFFWITPAKRGAWANKMLLAMEEKATSLGCTVWAMVSLENQRPEAVAKFYKRKGYLPLEYRFYKKLT